jgi:xylulokinase
VKVAVGGGDNMMAAIGTGCVTEGRLAMSLGTSGTLFAYSGSPMIDPDGAWAAFCSSTGGWLPLICTMNCTVATERVASAFGFSTRDGDAHLHATPPGAGAGDAAVPQWRTYPDLPLGKGVLAGLDIANFTPAHLYRAAMEGATYSLKYGYDAFVRAGMQFDRIVLTGGGSNSAAWRQLVADVRPAGGRPGAGRRRGVWCGTAGAVGARPGAGDATSISDITARHVTVDPALSARPDPARSAAYARAYARFLSHLDAITPLQRG